MTRSCLPMLCLPIVAGCAPAPPPAAVAPPSPAPAITPPPPAPSAAGVWLGTLQAGAQRLRLQLRYDPASTAHRCALDSLDQRSFGIPCDLTVGPGDAIAIDVPAVKGRWAGRISADGRTLSGTWTQGSALPLDLTKQDRAIERPTRGMLPAMAPVDVAGLKAVLDTDLRPLTEGGVLAPSTGIGVVIGVVQNGKRVVLAYGSVKPDALFEIGSITKTFTGLALAQLVEQKKARLDEPVRDLLPPGTVAKPQAGAEITLIDLSDQHSGLPRMPDNFHPADHANPYADYDDEALFAFLGSHGVARPAGAPFLYSNLGVGLLGTAIAHRAGVSYEALVHRQITGPLGMHETVITIPPALEKRFAEGHDAAGKPARRWDQAALAGAGAIRSTAADLLVYLSAQLHPDHLPASATRTPEGRTLAAAIRASHVVHGDAGEGKGDIAIAWMIGKRSGTYWHNGATGGYSSFLAFNPAKDRGVVVLTNVTVDDDALADTLGDHVLQRLNGDPAVSLAPPR